MLSIGLNYSTTDTTAYFRCLSLLSECPRRTPTEFLFRMEPHRGTLALQKLPLADKGIGPAGFAFSWI
jgi:hypothetical protein